MVPMVMLACAFWPAHEDATRRGCTYPASPARLERAAPPVPAARPPRATGTLMIARSPRDEQDRASAHVEPNRAHEIWRAEDGLFYVEAEINGAHVRFLVDTGASMIVLTPEDARRVGAAPDPASAMRVAETANGTSRMAPVTLAEVQLAGHRATAVRAAIAGSGLSVSLLGQGWLSYLDAVTIEGDRMTLR